MKCIAKYEIESDISVVSDDVRLEFKHPEGRFQARIKNIMRGDFSTPFLLSLQIIFEAPSLNEAKDIAEDRLAECLNMLAFSTGSCVRKYRIKCIVDCTSESGMNNAFVWSDSAGHEDPQPFLDENIIASIERLLHFDPPPAVRRALRWYRIGIYASVPEDQFQYFWFALEILAEFQKTPEKVHDRCPDCKSPLYCETCKTHSTHKPYVKQAIRALIQAAEKGCDEKTLVTLDKARNAIMHGTTLKEIDLPIPGVDIVDVLGRILHKALLNTFPREIFKEKLNMGHPSTYIHRTMLGIAHISTVFSKGDDGEIDLDLLTGLKVSMETDGPPQSGLPSVLVMTPDQHRQLGLLMRDEGDHQELCKRVYKRAKMHHEKVAAQVLATDMARIRGALKRGETGSWQDIFREIMSANPSE